MQRRRTTPYLILHEEVEKTLIEQLNLHYLHAHQIAPRAEQAAVRAAGVRWRGYDRFMQKYVKRIGDERLTKVPADLDLKPYRDEHDYDLVRRMLASIAHGQGPKGIKAKDVDRAVDRYMPRMRDFKAKPKGKRQANLVCLAKDEACSSPTLDQQSLQSHGQTAADGRVGCEERSPRARKRVLTE